MKRNRMIRLTESDLHRIVSYSVKKLVREAVMPQQMETENDVEGIIQQLFDDGDVYNAIVQSCGGFIKTDSEYDFDSGASFEFDQDDFIWEVLDYFVKDEDANTREDIFRLLNEYGEKHMKDWNWDWLEREAEKRMEYNSIHYGG